MWCLTIIVKGEDMSCIIEENLVKGGNSQPKLVIVIKKLEGLQKWNIHFQEPTDLLNIKSMQHGTRPSKGDANLLFGEQFLKTA